MSKRNDGQQAGIEALELNRETVQDLSEKEAEGIEGGMVPNTRYCHSQLKTCISNNVGC